MKKNWVVLFCMMLSIVILMKENVSFAESEVSSQRISDIFEDDNLARVVADMLKKEPTDDVTEAELDSIITIMADNKNIESLSGIERLRRLKYFSAEHNRISDITMLAENKQLESVYLGYNHIYDISSLNNLRLNYLIVNWQTVESSHYWDNELTLKNPIIGSTFNTLDEKSKISNNGVYYSKDDTIIWDDILDENELTISWYNVYQNIERYKIYSFFGTYTISLNKESSVIVRYVDELGNNLVEDKVINGEIGDPYKTRYIPIDGWTIKTIPENDVGLITEEVQEVIYIYSKNLVPGKDVNVYYLDSDGNEIYPTITLEGNIGEAYTSEEKIFPQYTLIKVKGDVSGIFSDKSQEIIYYYLRDSIVGANVTVHYIDSEGEEISSDIILSGNEGEEWEAEQLVVDGYTFSKVIGEVSGKYTNQEQEITFVYLKNQLEPVLPIIPNNPVEPGPQISPSIPMNPVGDGKVVNEDSVSKSNFLDNEEVNNTIKSLPFLGNRLNQSFVIVGGILLIISGYFFFQKNLNESRVDLNR